MAESQKFVTCRPNHFLDLHCFGCGEIIPEGALVTQIKETMWVKNHGPAEKMTHLCQTCDNLMTELDFEGVSRTWKSGEIKSLYQERWEALKTGDSNA
jgi:hypothetical protein